MVFYEIFNWLTFFSEPSKGWLVINPLLTFENLENTKYAINTSEMKIKKKKILKERTSRKLT